MFHNRMERMAMEAMQRVQQGVSESPDIESPKYEKNPLNRHKKTLKQSNLNSIEEKEDKKGKKKQKLYCVCRTPYDKAR